MVAQSRDFEQNLETGRVLHSQGWHANKKKKERQRQDHKNHEFTRLGERLAWNKTRNHLTAKGKTGNKMGAKNPGRAGGDCPSKGAKDGTSWPTLGGGGKIEGPPQKPMESNQFHHGKTGEMTGEIPLGHGIEAKGREVNANGFGGWERIPKNPAGKKQEKKNGS